MELLINIFGIAALGYMLQEFEPYQWITEKLNMPDKPFRCTLCATFWYSIGAFLAVYGLPGVAYAALAAVIAELIDRKLWNN